MTLIPSLNVEARFRPLAVCVNACLALVFLSLLIAQAVKICIEPRPISTSTETKSGAWGDSPKLLICVQYENYTRIVPDSVWVATKKKPITTSSEVSYEILTLGMDEEEFECVVVPGRYKFNDYGITIQMEWYDPRDQGKFYVFALGDGRHYTPSDMFDGILFVGHKASSDPVVFIQKHRYVCEGIFGTACNPPQERIRVALVLQGGLNVLSPLPLVPPTTPGPGTTTSSLYLGERQICSVTVLWRAPQVIVHTASTKTSEVVNLIQGAGGFIALAGVLFGICFSVKYDFVKQLTIHDHGLYGHVIKDRPLLEKIPDESRCETDDVEYTDTEYSRESGLVYQSRTIYQGV